MDWWSRLVGTTPKKPGPKTSANDPEVRLARFKRNYHAVLGLCNRPRNLTNEEPLLKQLHALLERIDVIIREETRAPAPHLCLQFAASNQIYTLLARAAAVSHHEPIIQATVSVLAALIDSEEEDFLSNALFAKSLMRLVTRAVDGESILISSETETAILELLFTIAAKIRLQPEILSFWFRSTAKPELEDVFVRERKSFVGITQKDDFPLCYILIDRVHHEGRIGDFARTGLLYIFEATGRSVGLEEWIVSSDLPTLMASGVGALYSQLSRELSILHPDSTLPAVLAMSDYSTTHLRATAESAFSERHRIHMATFLSYLAFWQDVLDHCKSADVKQTLLDHFQILFLQQLLYPSLLQSSDRDAGSSVAVLTYMTAMLESLEYPDLINMMLAYLLAVQDHPLTLSNGQVNLPRSPTSLRRRQSLMILAAPKDPEDAVEPILFSLVDLVLNNIGSRNTQSVFAALKLASSLLTRQKKFAFGTLLKVQKPRSDSTARILGSLELEIEKLAELTVSIHDHVALDEAYTGLTEDVRLMIEAQVPSKLSIEEFDDNDHELSGRFLLSSDDHFLRALTFLLRTFFTNSVDVNLALTDAIVSIALCIEIRLDSWFAIDPATYDLDDTASGPTRIWQTYLDGEEREAFAALHRVSRRPIWSWDQAPMLFTSLRALVQEFETVRTQVPNLDHLLAGRKNMLQATGLDAPMNPSDPPSLTNSPMNPSFLDVPKTMRNKSRSRSSSASSLARSRKIGVRNSSHSPAASPARNRTTEKSASPARSIFLPPPPDAPSTTDILMKLITFPDVTNEGNAQGESGGRKASLNHVLTNAVVLQEFMLELIAVLQVRAAVLREKEIRFE